MNKYKKESIKHTFLNVLKHLKCFFTINHGFGAPKPILGAY